MRIDPHPDGALVDGRVVSLSPNERALLTWLAANRGAPQPRDALLVAVFGYRAGVRSRTVDSTVNRLRARLAAAGVPVPIRSVRGRGWMIDGRDDPRPALIGRDTELEQVARWWAGDGRLLTVTGPLGIGKSALVAEALGGRALRIDGAAVRRDRDWLHALAATRGGCLWVDDADDVQDELVEALGARRVVITRRSPLHRREEEVLRLGALDVEAAVRLAERHLARWFPGAIRARGELLSWVDASEGNPFALEVAIRASESTHDERVTERVERSLRGLPAELADGLLRLAGVPVPVPIELARELCGSERALVALRERSLVLARPEGTWSVPRLIRTGLPPTPPTFVARVCDWTAQHVERAHQAGEPRWGTFLRDLGPWRPALEWVASVSPSAQAAWWAALALDDGATRLGGAGGPDRRPVLGRGLAAGSSEAWVRRAWEQRRHGLLRAALDDLAQAEALSPGEPPANDVWYLQAFCLFLTGAAGEAERLAERVVARAEREGEPLGEVLALGLLALASQWRGDPGGALARGRAAAAVPVVGEFHRRALVHLAAYEADAGLDGAALRRLDEVDAQVAQTAEVTRHLALTERVWIEVATTGASARVADMAAAVAELTAARVHDARFERMKLGWALLVVGQIDAGLHYVRSATEELTRAGEVLHATRGRVFAMAARVALGLPPRAAWLPSDALEGDPVILALGRGFEALARGDSAGVAAALDAAAPSTGRRARALARWLRDAAAR